MDAETIPQKREKRNQLRLQQGLPRRYRRLSLSWARVCFTGSRATTRTSTGVATA